MTIRVTTSLPATNDYKPATSAKQALSIYADKFLRYARLAELVATSEIDEEDCEALLTMLRNRTNNQLTELDAWRVL